MLPQVARSAEAQTSISVPHLRAGAAEIVGFVDPPSGDVRRVVVEIRRETPPGTSECLSNTGAIVDRMVATAIDAETGRFSVKLSAALAKGDCIVAAGTTVNGTTLVRTVAPRVLDAERPPAVKPPDIKVPVRAGTRIVSGWIPGGKDLKIDKVVVTVRRSRDDRYSAELRAKSMATAIANVSAAPDPAAAKPIPAAAASSEAAPADAPAIVARAQTSEIGADGAFNLALPQPLIDGQDIEVAVFAGASRLSSATTVVEDPGDWGRVRAYFAGGVILSQSRDEFSKQDFVLALVVDSAWYQPTPPQLILPEEDRECTKVASLAVRSANVNPPVSPTRPNEPNSSAFDNSGQDQAAIRNYRRLLPKTDPCWKSRWWARLQINSFFDVRMTALPVKATAAGSSGAAGSPAPQTAAAAGDEFITARKAALLQFGFYAPLYGRATMWNFQGHRNALFVAPVVRGGVQTISVEDSMLALSGEDDDNVYSFISYGFGIGHYKLSDTKDRAPELISYLQITRGPFENFREAGDDPKFRPQRWAIEGRMKIPETPLQIGLDANLGKGPDSIAFTFATRFDIGELFGKLKTFKPQQPVVLLGIAKADLR